MPSIAELRASRLAAINSPTPAAPTPGAPASAMTAEQLATTRTELAASLARMDALLASGSAAPAAAEARQQTSAALQGLTGEALHRAQWRASAELQAQFYSEGSYLGWMRHQASRAGATERDLATRCSPQTVGSATARDVAARSAPPAPGVPAAGTLQGEPEWRRAFAASAELQGSFHSADAYVGFKANEPKIRGESR